MTLQKPSDKEEEYFARKEYERLKALAEEQAKQEAEKERKERQALHYMHCPKCGGDLVEIAYREVHIDKCTSCAGIWLDAGELETILETEDNSLVKRILKVFQ
ncbi:MAG: zf-TFIIB domain-containing protein [Myxococcota bacterium]|nr:zf-TFIIB domain-containing protein [Myxococcota bacterium]